MDSVSLLLIANLSGLILLAFFVASRKSNSPDIAEELKDNRKELASSLKDSSDSINKQLLGVTKIQSDALSKLGEQIERRLMSLQEDNNKQLDRMRQTVDEKLQSTLEKRLGESFRQVGKQLESVHKGLGEMQTLATGVGDLQRVLSNVKTRGAWGEAQLGALLEEILNPEQYLTNVVTKQGSNDPVEFALKIPGKDSQVLLLPIDAKLPLDRYEALLKAQEQADKVAHSEALKAFENQIKLEAKRISEKYIDPPSTTDFAVMYLPIEGLYAEVVQQTGMVDSLRKKYNVAIAGPTTILPILNFVQMGYRTLAIQKRTSEVWQVLTATREEFSKFGDLMDKAKKKLVEASNVIDSATAKSRNIEGKLNKVQRIAAPEKSDEQDAA
ncbi:DNA recombination protein RmuC [Candidatus Saccharibacteria bacterium]|nr:DNA recombination protein RmuC [Candidatus Saccharibacteria bacterium]MCB9821646.1 DNA recombination protein RmuC [Candidatus Nomurabacteria bacterium]